ncbi:MAG: hypothetical protein KBG02_09880 [Haliscomenobacter sp.]|nr:hypothetical protein [Haliscomenobacter sp.]MBK8654676.1 hypothetical protein [Haliscomenobacter sp.]MBP9077157.1 hypothetical protein [Haliscomenobacter sp.]MBP9875179.1 hypothetical protein [Haliscomenobacter sp.]
MKRFMAWSMAAFGLLAWVSAAAQPGPGPGGRDQLRQELNLNEEQEEQLVAVLGKYRGKLQNLREDQTLAPQERRSELQKMMEQQRTEVDAILTDEQMAKWEALRRERMQAGGMRQGPNPPQGNARPGQNPPPNQAAGKRNPQAKNRPAPPNDRQAAKALTQMQQEVRAYNDQRVIPVLKEERAQLEKKISRKDRELLASLRTQMKSGHLYGGPAAGKAKNSRAMKDQKADLAKLSKKYKKDIDKIFAGLEPEVNEWNKDLKAIRQKYARDLKAQPKNPRAPQPTQMGNQWLNPERFLLMEPAL